MAATIITEIQVTAGLEIPVVLKRPINSNLNISIKTIFE